jgi:hypothetical protein
MVYKDTPTAANKPGASRMGSRRGSGVVFGLLTAVVGACVAVAADARLETPQNASGAPARKTYTLRIAKAETTAVSLNAERARLSELAADLSKRLNAKVIVGPTLENETVSARFSELPLDQALTSLVPRVLIDYEIRQAAQPVPLGIYLLGHTDPEPLTSAVVRANSQGLYIAGHTEETEKPSKDDPLRVRYENNRLTVFAKQQPLLAVVMTIAEVLGVPAEIKHETAETVDTDIQDAPLAEDAIVGISPKIRLYVRVDAIRGQRTLLHLAVVPPVGNVAK